MNTIPKEITGLCFDITKPTNGCPVISVIDLNLLTILESEKIKTTTEYLVQQVVEDFTKYLKLRQLQQSGLSEKETVEVLNYTTVTESSLVTLGQLTSSLVEPHLEALVLYLITVNFLHLAEEVIEQVFLKTYSTSAISSN